jgi:Flp pilus assembly protein TadD
MPSRGDPREAALGVHFSVLAGFARDYPGLTTTQLCEAFVKPETRERQCAYLDMLLDAPPLPSGKPLVGPAKCFVSHAWMCKYAVVLECMADFEQKHPDTYFWFDLVTNNQHKATSFPFEWWCTTFKESIRSIGSVLLVMTPWDRPIPLTRAWCLFEIYSTIDVDARMHVSIPASQRREFQTAMAEDLEKLTKVMVELDAEKAIASNPNDREQIFAVIRTQIAGGFTTLNNTVKDKLREWYLDACVTLASEESDAELLYNLGAALGQFGELDKAEQIFQQALRAMIAIHGEESLPVATVHSALGNVANDRSEYQEALRHFNMAAKIMLAHGSGDDPDLASIYLSIGYVHNETENADKAHECFEKALAIFLQAYGENHPETARAYNSLGIIYGQRGEFERALEYYEKDLAITIAAVGENHPDTGRSYNALGFIHDDMGDYARAIEYFNKDLAISLATLGREHPDTARSYGNLAQSHRSSGDRAKARECYVQALEIFQATLGDAHPHTQSCVHNLKTLDEGK